MKVAVLGLVFTVFATACETEAPVGPEEIVASPREADSGRQAGFQRCAAAFSPSPAAGWRHWTSRIVSALRSPVHSASDVIVAPGAGAALQARFAYGGIVDKELEDEWVWVFVNDCSAWRYVGYARTDDEGRVTFNLGAGLAPGRYEVRMEVVGDATWVPLRLWVLPAGTHLTVVDIDGTLTTDDGEVFEQILLGHQPDAYPGAATLTWAEADRNEVVVYLTGRPEILAGLTRNWLDGRGFAPGAVKLARTAGEILPINSGVGDYKLRYLRSLESGGLVLDDAFGNATTDIYAYAGAGIPVGRTWIIGPNAGGGGTHAVTGSWDDVAADIADDPPAAQPF